MTHMFDNYPQPVGYIPTNRKIKYPCEEVVIMPGETTTHSFEIPFKVEDIVSDGTVMYKLGLDIVLEKPLSEADVVYDDTCNITILTWILTPADTSLFKHTLLDTQVQIKFIMKTGETAYTEIIPVKVEDSLEV